MFIEHLLCIRPWVLRITEKRKKKKEKKTKDLALLSRLLGERGLLLFCFLVLEFELRPSQLSHACLAGLSHTSSHGRGGVVLRLS
jgi:hypothetical protein